MREEKGIVRRLLIVAVVAALPVIGPASADELADGFAEADVDGDGRLDGDEYIATIVLSFGGRDEDRDGLLTSAKLPKAFGAALDSLLGGGTGRRVATGVGAMVGSIAGLNIADDTR